ncbi:MAG TPA: hypothetical protein VF780_07050 [Nitrosospira sp.]
MSFRKLHKLLLVLIMVGLPLQGALAAIMPLCTQAVQAQKTATGIEAPIHSATPAACSQHDVAGHPQPATNDNNLDEAGFTLSCDDVVCHISGSGLLPAVAALNHAGGSSYNVAFNPRFTSSILPQPQRPPLS